MSERAAPAMVRVWDGPTRLFKWTLVALIVAAPLTKWYGDITLYWHRLVGYAILTLVLWRVLWGFFGGRTARFSDFVCSPVAAARHGLDLVRGRKARFVGHNPLGGWMILALLALVGLQAFAGLFSTDDIITDGPLRHLAPPAFAGALTRLHHQLPVVLLALVAVHVLANLAYSLAGDNLIGAMITGRKRADAVDSGDVAPGSSLLAAALLAVSAGIVFGGLALFGRGAF